jgi:hypothetical protein
MTSTETKHTPKPWHHRPVVNEIQAGPLNVKVAQMPMDGQGRAHDENLANARLIAAAPELLEACKAALHAMRTGNSEVSAIDGLVAAIAKAAGESHD